jgi:predicted protein tyrosine phosphatase
VEILVYVNPADPAKERFFQAISKVPSLSPTFVLEQERFIPLLRNTARWWGAIVYVVSDQDDLDLAISMKAYLSNTRVIMVLSEWVETRVKMGLSLSPSLITKANGDFSDVIAVLEKISTIAQQSCNHGG